MNAYYTEFMENINDMIEKGQLQEAKFLIDKELELPYLPLDAEETLRKTQKDLVYAIADTKTIQEESLESLLSRLMHGKQAGQLYAAEKLADRNLRSITKQLQAYLQKDPLPEAAALIIDAIAEQEIQEEFVLRRNGLEYTFYGDSVTPVHKSEGFRAIMKELEEVYAKEPSTLQIARSILIHKAYLYLPLSYETSEVGSVVKEIQEEIEQLYED